eukprot:371242-Prorocentrum_minimum.AAC.1
MIPHSGAGLPANHQLEQARSEMKNMGTTVSQLHSYPFSDVTFAPNIRANQPLFCSWETRNHWETQIPSCSNNRSFIREPTL